MSERAWTGAALVSLVLLVASAWVTGQADLGGPQLAACRADPAHHAHAQIEIFREARVLEVAADGTSCTICERGLDACCRLEGAPASAPGESISAVGTFEPPDRVRVIDAHVHHGRFLKVYASVPAVLWVVFLLIRHLRPGASGLEER